MAQNPHDFHLTKQLRKMMNRIEKILAPSNAISNNLVDVGPRLEVVMKKIQDSVYYRDPEIKRSISSKKKQEVFIEPTMECMFSNRTVDWESLEPDIIQAITNNDKDFQISNKVLEEIYTERKIQIDAIIKLRAREKLQSLEDRNDQPMLPGRWHREPFPPRTYDRIENYVVAAGNDHNNIEVLEQLNTPLSGFLGQAYNYDDQGLTEEWMVTFKDKNFSASNNDVIRTQIVSLLEIMTQQVQDRVCNEIGVVNRAAVGLGSMLREAPVWGIDSYTRTMLELIITDHHPKACRRDTKEFIERKLLPSINATPSNIAHNMTHALNRILEIERNEEYLKFASTILAAIPEYGIDLFKIHPKGTGVICSHAGGIPPHVVVAHYLGELYAPHRWCEKLDVVQQAQEKYGLKPTLPDFYNILLERPRQDPNGYGLLYVDASRRANLGSSCSHSCDANCTSSVAAKDGKLVIVLTTNRHVYEGEELSMDYYSITTSDVEWRAAICLCGMTTCRGSFLHYATQDDLQQVLNQNCGPLWRYATLLRSCSNIPLQPDDYAVLDRHGLKSALFGSNPMPWILKYAAENLKFVEFERKALPCALMRRKDGSSSQYTYSAADMDARSVMEQRIQSMVCCFSSIREVLRRQSDHAKQSNHPVRVLSSIDAAEMIWKILETIPALLGSFALQLVSNKSTTKKLLLSSSSSSSKENVRSSNTSSDDKNGSTSNCKNSTTKKDKENKSTTVKENVESSEESIKKANDITATMKIITDKLRSKPDTLNLTIVRALCLDIRLEIMKISYCSSSTARLDQLAVVLILWGYTINFSTIQEYESIQSDGIIVYARDLGNNIPRIKVFKPEVFSRRRQPANVPTETSVATMVQASMSAAAVTGSNMSDDMTMTEIESSVDLEPENNAAIVAEPMDIASTNDGHVYESEQPSLMCDDNITITTTDAIDISEDGEDTTILFSKSISTASKKRPSKRDNTMLAPDEPVLLAAKNYEPLFIFWQLMGWYNAGTDDQAEAPDLLGCVELPLPCQCFGEAASGYGQKQREALIAHLRNEKSQLMPWPQLLKSSFSKITSNPNSVPIYGSPTLDAALGKIDSIMKVLTAFGVSQLNRKAEDLVDTSQFDNILPPEMPTQWVQCDDIACRRWRRLPFYVDPNVLPDYWTCYTNTWDPENASCSAPQDSYNPEKESTVAYQADTRNEKEFEIDTWKDVFCVHNHIYYEAQIKARRKPIDSELEELKFHFKGWSSCFDEWIDIDSDRIQPHNLYTNPVTCRVADQEKWQGMARPTKPLPKPKVAISKGKASKRKSTGSTEEKKSSSAKKPRTEKAENKVETSRHSYPAYMYADDFAMSDEDEALPRSNHVENKIEPVKDSNSESHVAQSIEVDDVLVE